MPSDDLGESAGRMKALSDHQWLIMEALWEKHPMYLGELTEAMQDQGTWQYSMYLTYLKRLMQEGYVTYTEVRGSRLYSPAVTRESCIERASWDLLTRMTKSNTRLLVTNMIKEGGLDEADCKALRHLIDQFSAKADTDDN